MQLIVVCGAFAQRLLGGNHWRGHLNVLLMSTPDWGTPPVQLWCNLAQFCPGVLTTFQKDRCCSFCCTLPPIDLADRRYIPPHAKVSLWDPSYWRDFVFGIPMSNYLLQIHPEFWGARPYRPWGGRVYCTSHYRCGHRLDMSKQQHLEINVYMFIIMKY